MTGCDWLSAGSTDAVQLLLEAGGSLADADSFGDSPLHRACHHGHLPMIKYLMQNGCDIHKLNDVRMLVWWCGVVGREEGGVV